MPTIVLITLESWPNVVLFLAIIAPDAKPAMIFSSITLTPKPSPLVLLNSEVSLGRSF